MEDSRIPKTKEECFALLDKELSEEEKLAIKKTKYASKYFFSLGLWIRNNWLYPMNENEKRELMKQFIEPNEQLMLGMMCFDGDMASSKIIESYQKYLKSK